jgi:CheW-like domain
MSLRGRKIGPTTQAPTSRFLVVTLDARIMALDANAVRGLLTSAEAGQSDLVTVQGVSFRAVDLAGRLSLSPGVDGRETRTVLLSSEKRHGSIRVDRVLGLIEVDQTRVLPLPRQFQGEEQHWYRGMIVFEDTVAVVLHTAWVLEGLTAGLDGAGLGWQGSEPHLLKTNVALATGEAQVC